MTVGFIGLGKMGGPMAANVAAAQPGSGLLRRGRHTKPACRSALSLRPRSPTSPAGARPCWSACPTARRRWPWRASSSAGESVAVETVVDLSTIGPQAATEAAALLGEAGITYCDGPVSGGAAGARAATISLMFAGPAAVLDAHRALLESFTGNVFHVGERAGQGQAMKLANNLPVGHRAGGDLRSGGVRSRPRARHGDDDRRAERVDRTKLGDDRQVSQPHPHR